MSLVLLLASPAQASHGSTGCVDLAAQGIRWNEGTREGGSDTDSNEDGATGYPRINYPDGGPVEGMVRSLFLWLDPDNHAEIGWAWARPRGHTSPRKIAAWTDAGTPNDSGDEGFAGNLNSYHKNRVVNDTGVHVTWSVDDVTIHARTFFILSQGNVSSNSEVWNTCDSAWAHFRDLTELECVGCGWNNWTAIVNWKVGMENPCYHTRIPDNTQWYAEHGSGSGEVCQAP
jgi:hypothetical protein